MIGFPSFNLFFLLYQKNIKKARDKQAFSKIVNCLQPFMVFLNIKMLHKRNTCHI
ncbi:hypothetical protein SAIN_0469 [Streptococcus anginosus C1051]|nr:hypothetical protein SAIN_0469 [Streptococcus anginosus C1051]